MSLEVERVKAEQNIHIDFMEWLMLYQIFFESERVGSDGSLYEYNTLEHGITRGIIGEAQEALEELRELRMAEILTPDQTELLDKLKENLQCELADVLIFLASVFTHADMTPGKVMEVAAKKMRKNNEKYRTEFFNDKRTVAETMQYSRESWENGQSREQTGESRLAYRSSLLGEPMEPSSNGSGKEPQEFEVYTARQGAIN